MLIEKGLRRPVIIDQNIYQLQVGRWPETRHAKVTGFDEQELTADGVLAHQSKQLSAEWCATALCSQKPEALGHLGCFRWVLLCCECSRANEEHANEDDTQRREALSQWRR